MSDYCVVLGGHAAFHGIWLVPVHEHDEFVDSLIDIVNALPSERMTDKLDSIVPLDPKDYP